MQTVFPSGVFYKRQGHTVKKIVDHATSAGFTDIVIVNEDQRAVNGLIVCHLPDGPTATFKVSSAVLTRDIKNHGRASSHKPELVLNNFSTRLGLRVGRIFASLFCQDPTFRGRRVVTFHNQRDYIFFRHHRYIFEEQERNVIKTEVDAKTGKKRVKSSGKETVVKTRLQELGPRFTLKLVSLQKGTFDPRTGEFEWLHKRGEMDKSRRKFHL
jgi:ribosome production factor 1